MVCNGFWNKVSLLIVATGVMGVSVADATRLRKDQANLSAAERTAFVNALHSMKNTFNSSSGLSVYDEFVYTHAMTMQYTPNPAHMGSAFLPWHRQYIWEFETTLLAHDTTNTLTGLPFWNWSVDQVTTQSPWTDDFLGGDGDPDDNYIVKSGPFREGEWFLPEDLSPEEEGDIPLQRAFGVFEGASTLPTADDVAEALLIGTYDANPWNPDAPLDQSFRNFLEGWWEDEIGLHNRVHMWVGGSMAPMTSPIDPVFWLHHSYVDRIWYEWQGMYGIFNYEPITGGPEGYNLNDIMEGLNVAVADTLDPRDYDGVGFTYEGVVIPEPAHLATIFSLAVIALVFVRRRKSRSVNSKIFR